MGVKFEEVIRITRNVISYISNVTRRVGRKSKKSNTHTKVDVLGEVEAMKDGGGVNKAVCSVNTPKGTL
jgi:hypothetical protein